MKAVILAGGFGTRISEESHNKPKPMIEIGGVPIIYHIMQSFLKYGIDDFLILAGYRQEYIKNYFINLKTQTSDVTIDYRTDEDPSFFNSHSLPVRITVLNTGLHTMTGGRLLRAKDYLKEEKEFLLTYGDGLCDVDIEKLIDSHRNSQNIVTITSVNPGSRFGTLVLENDQVKSFREKHQESDGWINGGFMVMNHGVFDYLEDDSTILERAPFENISSDNKMGAFLHNGFWQCMDTLRDKEFLEKMIETKNTPWM